MSTVRRIVLIGFAISCAVILIMFISSVNTGRNPVIEPLGSDQFADLPGHAAKQRLQNVWPKEVDPGTVHSVSYKAKRSRDSYLSWYRIQLPPVPALTWMNSIHSNQEQASKTRHQRQEETEGVHRIVDDPADLPEQAGTIPKWWSPPRIEFRTTEVMKWYKYTKLGLARATYSAFDQTTNTLWIFEFASQHENLWPRHQLPEGRHFATSR
jgi:hypothetical protein